MRIAVDTMGGDKGSDEACMAGIDFLREHEDVELVFFGPRQNLEKDLDNDRFKDQIKIVDAPSFIDPGEEPVRAIRSKKDSSMVKSLEMVRDGEVDAMISPGNTGSLLAGAVMIVGKIAGAERPALAAELPSVEEKNTLLMDLGASVDVRPEHILHYAIMGTNYAQKVLDRREASVGLLNVGEEPKKGDVLRRESHDLLTSQLKKIDNCNFVGNIEPRDIMKSPADVVITDGFVGNILLKTVEGTEEAMISIIEQAMGTSFMTRLGSALLLPTLRGKLREFDYKNYGGAILLGVSSVIIKCHGSSDREAFENALVRAKMAAEEEVPSVIENSLQERTK